MQFVQGLQEDDDHPGRTKIVATGKHYMDYDCENCRALGDTCMPSSGNQCKTDRTNFNAEVTTRDQVEYYWPAWRAAAAGGRIKSVMCSYNAINSVPACGDNFSMNAVLRGEFNFSGMVVSDCGAIGDGAFSNYVQKHFDGDKNQQARLGVQSGCDLNCGSFYTGHINDAVAANILPQSDVDTALHRIWTHFFSLGLADSPSENNPFRDVAQYGPQQVDTPGSRALALAAAEQSMVLLKNEGGLLPLQLAKTKIAMIGPNLNVTNEMLSNYASEANQLVLLHSPWSAFTRGGAVVTAAVAGCNDTQGNGQSDIDCLEDSGFAEAEAAAKAVDVVLLFMGLRPAAFTPKNASSDAWEGEGRDRISTSLPGLQPELIRRVAAANSNTVLVLIHASPLSIEDSVPQVAAILSAHYPGELGGDAIFRTVYGQNAPAGRLTTTWYDKTFIAARPITDMSLRDRGGITYMHYERKPVFGFGFGLGYTTFQFSVVGGPAAEQCHTQALAAHHPAYYASGGAARSPCGYRVRAENTGGAASDIVVLAFLSSPHADAPRNGELFGFVREAMVAPAESRTVALSVPAQVISLVDARGNEWLRAGDYSVAFGVEGSAEGAPARAALELGGDDVLLFNHEELARRHRGRGSA